MSLVLPYSNKIVLAAGATKLQPARALHASFQIASGGSAKVSYTLATAAEVEAGTAEYIDWPHGDKVGPFLDSVEAHVVCYKITAGLSGATVYMFER